MDDFKKYRRGDKLKVYNSKEGTFVGEFLRIDNARWGSKRKSEPTLVIITQEGTLAMPMSDISKIEHIQKDEVNFKEFWKSNMTLQSPSYGVKGTPQDKIEFEERKEGVYFRRAGHSWKLSKYKTLEDAKFDLKMKEGLIEL
jgi:hypothetical protein